MNEAELNEQARLQRRKQVMGIIHQHPLVKGSELMLLRKMSKITYQPDPEVSYNLWTQVHPQTPTQAQAVFMPFGEFQDLHQRVQQYIVSDGSWDNLRDTVRLYSGKNSPVGPGYSWNDQHEISQKPTKTLAILRENGVTISFPSEGVRFFQTHPQDSQVPLLEIAKNTRFATINGFAGSLMTLAIHDTYDHVFTFDVLDKAGLLDRYQGLFQRIGNPQSTDIYAREGELVASVTYNTRSWTLVEEGIEPTMTVPRLIRLLSKQGKTTENQERSLDSLTTISSDKEASRRVGYIATRVLIQLMEQRRKQGFIRDLNSEFKPTGIFPLTDPEYMAFVVELALLMDAPKTNSINALVNTTVLVEEYMNMLATDKQPANMNGRLQIRKGRVVPDLVLKTTDLNDPSVLEKCSLPIARLEWILSHPGSGATQEYLLK
jgi:hypothetical protein